MPSAVGARRIGLHVLAVKAFGAGARFGNMLDKRVLMAVFAIILNGDRNGHPKSPLINAMVEGDKEVAMQSCR
jgi:hypothetical protein